MLELKAPSRSYPADIDDVLTVFLAGSIEMGAAEDWQKKLISILGEDTNIVVFNPRRDDWDPSWEQKMDNPQFSEQVNWELDHLDKADLVVVYLDPKTKSPISLMELGLYAGISDMIVCCPEGFWRKGNVDIVCDRYNIPQVDSIEAIAKYIWEFKEENTLL